MRKNQSHPPSAHCQEKRKSVDHLVIKNDLKISIKKKRQPAFELAEDSVCCQGCCIDHETFEIMT